MIVIRTPANRGILEIKCTKYTIKLFSVMAIVRCSLCVITVLCKLSSPTTVIGNSCCGFKTSQFKCTYDSNKK